MIELLMIFFFMSFLVGDLITTDLALKLGRMTVGITIIETNPEHYGDTEVSLKMVLFKYIATIMGAVFAVYYQSLIAAVILVGIGCGLVGWNYRVITKCYDRS